MDENVKMLLHKAATAHEAHYAMNYAQAALNAAHALQIMQNIELLDQSTNLQHTK